MTKPKNPSVLSAYSVVICSAALDVVTAESAEIAEKPNQKTLCALRVLSGDLFRSKP